MQPRIHSTRFLGSAPASRGATWALHGQDGGQSIALGERTLFVFADTLIARNPAAPHLQTITRTNAHFLGNCAALSSESSLESALANLHYFVDEHGMPREILVPDPLERLAGHRFWPQHGIAAGDHVYLFYVGIHQFDPRSTWGFMATGSGLARLDPRTGSAERITRDGQWHLWRHGDDLRLGTQVLREGNILYVFGSCRVDGWTRAIVARVPSDRIEEPAAYEFSGALAECAPEFSVSFNPYLGMYLMTYVEGFGRELLFRTAPSPVGPYSEPARVGKLPHRAEAEVVSLGFEHPQFARDGGKTVFVSYCQPHFTQNSLVAVTFA